MMLRRMRALSGEEAARILDCSPDSLPSLAYKGLLHPIGNPPKYEKDDVERCRLELEKRHKAMDGFRRLGEEIYTEEWAE